MAQRELRLDELLRDARGIGLPDAISAPKAAELAGELGPSTASFTRYSAVPKDEEWYKTPWGTRATDNRIIDPNSVMGIARALGVNPRDVVLASATWSTPPRPFPTAKRRSCGPSSPAAATRIVTSRPGRPYPDPADAPGCGGQRRGCV